jgi:hypothetical protein
MEQVGVSLDFIAFFVASKVGKTGLTGIQVDVYKLDGTKIVTNGAAVAVGGGLYKYSMAASLNTGEDVYMAVFKTSDATVDMQHVPSMWLVGKGGIEGLGSPGAGGTAIGDWWWKKTQ